MVREDGKTNWTIPPTYDALLLRYLPDLHIALKTHLKLDSAVVDTGDFKYQGWSTGVRGKRRRAKQELKPEPLPTPTSSISELDQLSSKISQGSTNVLAELDGKFMMQELASASKSRDYINHLESKVSRESGYVEQLR